MKRFLQFLSLALVLVPIQSEAASDWTPEKLQKYVERKIKRNDKVLRINLKPIGDAGAKFLAEFSPLKNLTTLILYGAGIGDEGARSLAHSTTLANLTSLSLENNLVSDEGVKFLADSKTLSKLTTLNLYRNKIGNIFLRYKTCFDRKKLSRML